MIKLGRERKRLINIVYHPITCSRGWGTPGNSDSRPKWAKYTPPPPPPSPVIGSKGLNNPTLWKGTYLYGLYKGVPSPLPLPRSMPRDYRIIHNASCLPPTFLLPLFKFLLSNADVLREIAKKKKKLLQNLGGVAEGLTRCLMRNSKVANKDKSSSGLGCL